MNSEQGQAWQERAELAEQESARLSAVVQDLRDSLMKIRDEIAHRDADEMPLVSAQNAVRFAHGVADFALTKNGLNFR